MRKTIKERAKCRTVDMQMVTEQARTKCAEHTARRVQLEGDTHERKESLGFSEILNNVADSQFLC